jgi:phosphopantothenoylcysteine decarboxylase/phosphopantothenate--cysteine ligase
MRILITAGPTREYIDSVRFLSNASSGRMGCAVARAALKAGHEVTLLLGAVCNDVPISAGLLVSATRAVEHLRIVRFQSVAELQNDLGDLFPDCDALVMSAAVGDFQVDKPAAAKLSRRAGAITLTLVPTEDVLAGVASGKRQGQKVIAFAVEDGPPEQAQAKALGEMRAKNADLVVVNTPAALGATHSEACILADRGVLLPWTRRSKEELASRIVELLG